jgi:membrane protein YdbS with pleckstrin-like domain
MKELLKNIGPILMLIGVILLAIYYFTQSNSNFYLISAGVLMILGFFTHILVNRKVN